jgi:Zn finger protein HypA/HybF involved in hydrogenase expression
MNTTEKGLIPYMCPDCGKTYYALNGSRVYCPKCRKWIKSDTGTPDTGGQGPDTGKPEPIHAESEPERAKPFHDCERCGKRYRANSNREKYCDKCKPVMYQKSTRNRVRKFRSKMSRCNGLEACNPLTL